MRGGCVPETKADTADSKMYMRKSEVYWAAVLLGGLAGMRSMAAPAALGRLSQAGKLEHTKGALALVSRPGFAKSANLLAVAELVADKLPFTPNRTAAGPLLGRALMGGFAGASIFAAQRRPAVPGALIGAAAAVGAACAAFAIRKRIVRRSGWHDGVVALAEDAVVGLLGLAITSRLKAKENG